MEELCVIGEKSYFGDDYQDYNGHGTYCAKTINEINRAEFYSIKILDENLECSSRNLIDALEHCLTLKDFKIINLSLAIFSNKNSEKLLEIVEKLYLQGKIIVAAAENGRSTSLLADSKYTIGVSSELYDRDDTYHCDIYNKVQCKANGLPKFLYVSQEMCIPVGGTSKATAIISGQIVKILDNRPTSSFSEILLMLSKKNLYNDKQSINIKRTYELEPVLTTEYYYDIDILAVIVDAYYVILKLKIDAKYLLNYYLPNIYIKYGKNDFLKIVMFINYKLSINLKLQDLEYIDFTEVQRLYKKVERIMSDERI